jgi:protein-L-isoaspartate(D-aspartate) O-methyltransferase
VELVCGDGALGHPPGAPYHRIVLTVGSADIRSEWVAQLAPGGRLLVPLAVRGSQLSVAFDLGADGVLRSDSVRGCSFIRLRGIAAEPDAVVALPGGGALQPSADGPGVEVAAVAAALLDPGEPMAAHAALGPQDVWDGFGFWLALTERGAARLLRHRSGRGPVSALLSEPGAAEPGLATVEPPEVGTGAPVAIRPYGPAGAALAARMRAALERWQGIGRPECSAWRITVAPPNGAPPASGVVTVSTPLRRLLLHPPTAPRPPVPG